MNNSFLKEDLLCLEGLCYNPLKKVIFQGGKEMIRNKLFLLTCSLGIVNYCYSIDDKVDSNNPSVGKRSVAVEQHIPGGEHRLCLVAIENQTEDSAFKVYIGSSGARSLVLPQTTWEMDQPNKIYLTQRTALRIVCVKGAYETIFIHDEGTASGRAPNGYSGPYYLSMWLSYPYVNDEQKLYVRYAVKKGRIGDIGIRIDDQGNCQVIAYNDVLILH